MTYTTETQTVILQVQLGELHSMTAEELTQRFGRFFSEEAGRVEYPVSCDSHAFDVFRDEFEEQTRDYHVSVEHAAVIVLPYGPEDFVPFTEESAGYAVAELEAEPGEGWLI